jgi:hypothetical protein
MVSLGEFCITNSLFATSSGMSPHPGISYGFDIGPHSSVDEYHSTPLTDPVGKKMMLLGWVWGFSYFYG